MPDEKFDSFESMVKITAGASYLYKRLNAKGILELRKSMDIFLDKLVKQTDPMKNHREAQLIMMKKKEASNERV